MTRTVEDYADAQAAVEAGTHPAQVAQKGWDTERDSAGTPTTRYAAAIGDDDSGRGPARVQGRVVERDSAGPVPGDDLSDCLLRVGAAPGSAGGVPGLPGHPPLAQSEQGQDDGRAGEAHGRGECGGCGPGSHECEEPGPVGRGAAPTAGA